MVKCHLTSRVQFEIARQVAQTLSIREQIAEHASVVIAVPARSLFARSRQDLHALFRANAPLNGIQMIFQINGANIHDRNRFESLGGEAESSRAIRPMAIGPGRGLNLIQKLFDDLAKRLSRNVIPLTFRHEEPSRFLDRAESSQNLLGCHDLPGRLGQSDVMRAKDVHRRIYRSRFIWREYRDMRGSFRQFFNQFLGTFAPRLATLAFDEFPFALSSAGHPRTEVIRVAGFS